MLAAMLTAMLAGRQGEDFSPEQGGVLSLMSKSLEIVPKVMIEGALKQ